MTQGLKRLGLALSLLGAATLAVVGASSGLADAAVSRGPSHPIQAELIPLYDNANAADWTAVCSQTNGVVTFEGSYGTAGENPYTSWAPAAWEAGYPAKDFSALIYNAPDEATAPQPASACGSLAQQNIGYVYVGTWYDQLPPYFSSFLADAAQGIC